MTRFRKLIPVVVFLAACILALWVLGPQPPASGPLLQQVTATSALITRLDRAPVRVRLTVAPASPHAGFGAPPKVVTESAPTTRHALAVTGLSAHTTYRYRIEDLDGSDRTQREDGGEFRTAPDDAVGPVRFATVGDTGRLPWWARNFGALGLGRLRPVLEPLGGLGPQWDLARWIARQAPDFFLHLGDVIYPRGQMEGYEDGLFRPFDQVLRRTPVFPVVGNHDLMTDNGGPFNTVFALPRPADAPASAHYYTFTWGPLRVVVLNPVTDPTMPASPQGQFLERTLAAATERWKLVAMHYPVFCSSKYSDDQGLIQDFWPVFARHKVDLVLSGHSHDYQRFAAKDGVVQVIVGAGGHSIYEIKPDPRLVRSSEEYSFLLVTVQGDKLTGEAWAQGGAQLDLFELRK